MNITNYCTFILRNVQKDWIDGDDIWAMWEKTKYPIACVLGGELTRPLTGAHQYRQSFVVSFSSFLNAADINPKS